MQNTIFFKRLFFVLLFQFCFSAFISSQVVINEFMAANVNTIQDPDFGKNADWIELFNTTNQTIDLSGFYLSDDLGDATKWTLPNGTSIAANSYLIIWADGEEVGLHSNFKLSKSGEEIGLYNSLGVLLDSVVFDNQNSDISYGRATDGNNTFTFFETATPNASNVGNTFLGNVYYQPKFSIEGGVYQNTIQVELTSLGGIIRYTLDGTKPSDSSPIYNLPISISSSIVLRARVFEDEKIPGKTITHSYFFNENFDQRKLPVISIVTNPAHFWSPTIGLYTQDTLPIWEYPINVEFFENDGYNQAVFNEAAGVKVNGNNSWQFPQKILGIYFRNDYEKKRLEYPIFFDRDRDEFDYFALRASGNDQGETFIRDGLMQELTKGYMDFDLQGFRPASVYINGDYFGLYNIRSKQNEEYIEYYYGLERGEYDLVANDGEVDEGDSIAFQQLFALFNSDLSIPSNYDALTSIMDMDNLMDYFITEIWASNRSWGHNIKMWKPKTANSKWRFILKDLDRGMYGSNDNTIDYFTETVISPASYEYARVILRSLFLNENFANEFKARFADHLYLTFHPNRITRQAEKMKVMIENEIPYHLQEWMGLSTSYGEALESQEEFDNEILELSTFGTDRPTYLYRDIAEHFTVDTTAHLGLISFPQNGGKIHLNNLEIPEENWSGRYFKNIPIALKATSKTGHDFQGWSLATYERIIEKGSTWKYLDNGTNLSTTWRGINYNDASWAAGPAQLGYGEGDEQTLINFGGDDDNKFITTYLRNKFAINNVSDYTGQIVLNVLKDDGIVIYLNNEEVVRTNMPYGNIEYNTVAYHTIEGSQEDDFQQFVIDTELLQEGQNVLAIELHQRSGESSDLSFDLEFLAVKKTNSPIFSTEEDLNLSLSADTVLVANFASTGVCLLPEIIEQSTALTLACSPYHAVGNVTILPNVFLAIEPGVEIYMPEGASIIVKGDLQVQGTPNQKITIKPNPTTGAMSWGNLRFEHATGISILSNLVIEGTTKGYHPVRDDAAISSFYSTVAVFESTINNVFGKIIKAQNSSFYINQCNFYSTAKGNLIEYQNGTGSINNSDIKGNFRKNTNGIRFEKITDGVINQNKLYDFFGKNNNGISIDKSSTNIEIKNNFIHNITDKGILIADESQVNLHNNTIVNCNEGIAIKENAAALIDQNTFYNNKVAVRGFEKDLGTGGGIAEVSNSILSNSSMLAIESDALSSVTVNYSLSDTEVLTGNNNIFTNPKFTNPTQNNFHLSFSSPAINAGLENGNAIDLGTKSFDFSADPSLLISAINYHPVDNENAEFIEILNAGNVPVDLSGYEITEGVDLVFPNGTMLNAGEALLCVQDVSFFPNISQQMIEWGAGNLNDEGEKIRLEDGNEIIIDQVIYDNESPWNTGAAGQGYYLSLINDDIDNHFAESWMIEGLMVDNEDLENQNVKIIIHPNPVNELLQISLEGEEIEKIEVVNTLGQIVFQRDFSYGNDCSIDVSKWIRGVYFLKINENILQQFVVQ